MSVPKVPVTALPTEPPEIPETVKVSPSASVSPTKTSPVVSPVSLLLLLSVPVTAEPPSATVSVPSSIMTPVSFDATGALLFDPVMVITRVAMSVSPLLWS